MESEVKRGERHPCENCPRLASCSDDRVGAVDRVQNAKCRTNNEVDIFITGDGFLYNMVRIIAGTLIEIGKGERKAEDILKVLEGKTREAAGFTAPAQGLTLYEVEYE